MEEAMSDQPQNESNDVAEELRQLGKNIKEALRSAWGSEERQKLQQEIQSGLSELGNMLNQAADDFKSSQAGQNIKADIDDFKERLRTGEVESKVRSEILEALQTANRELKRATQSRQPPDEQNNP
jgi:hypothetical protein